METLTWGIAGLIGVGLVGCGGSGARAESAGGVPWAESVISCSPWEREPIPRTELVLSNNTWNESWAEGKPHSQCLTRRSKPGVEQYGWNWEWPAYKPPSSYGAPEVVFGWKAWDGGPSTSSALPRRIDDIESLEIDFAVELEGEDTYNLNTSMWINATDSVTAGINPADIRNEIMVWFSDPADLAIGDYDGTVTLNGIEFDLWQVVNEPDQDITHTWTMLTYAARDDRLQASFDLKRVLDDAIERGFVDPTHAVGGVELMSEIFGGRGHLWLDQFDVRVAP